MHHAGDASISKQTPKTAPRTVRSPFRSAQSTRQVAPRQTVIRRVEAVYHVKREDSDDESPYESQEGDPSSTRRWRNTPGRSRKVIQDEEDEEDPNEDGQEEGSAYDGADDASESDSDELLIGAKVSLTLAFLMRCAHM